MAWKVCYTIEYEDGKCSTVEFANDPDLNYPTYKIKGSKDIDAINDAIAYITEVLEENCLRVVRKGLQLEVMEPSDKVVFYRYRDFSATKTYILLDGQGKEYESTAPGQLGGHKKLKIYGKLDCPSARRHIEKGEYVKYRVFFPDETTAIEAGYRPCGICMKDAYKKWKEEKNSSTFK